MLKTLHYSSKHLLFACCLSVCVEPTVEELNAFSTVGDVCAWVQFSTMGVTGDPISVISATCPFLSGSDLSDCRSPFRVVCTAFCSDACWLKANQSVCTHEMSLVCLVTEKGSH